MMLPYFVLREPLPKQAGTYKGDLVILGSGPDVWAEYAEIKTKISKYDLMVINMTYFSLEHLHRKGLEKITHWASLHRDFFEILLKSRPDGIMTHTDQTDHSWNKLGIDGDQTITWPVNPEGTSSLFAVKVGILLGYDRIILAGIPLTNTPRYYDPPWGISFNHDRGVHIAWEQLASEYKGKILSMSGVTRDLLGTF